MKRLGVILLSFLFAANLCAAERILTIDTTTGARQGTCDTSSEVAAIIGDETGTGAMVFNTNPSIDIGSDTQIIFNDSEVLATDAEMTYNKTTDTLTIGNITVSGTVDGIDIATDVAANTLKDTNVTTNLSLGAIDATTMVVASSDGTDATLIEADTDDAGLLGSDKWDEIVASTSHISADGEAEKGHWKAPWS